MKRCQLCKIEKLLDCFYNSSSTKDLKYPLCKPCASKKVKAWNIKNPEKRRFLRARYSANNKAYERLKAKEWAQKNSARISERRRERRKKNIERFRNCERIRALKKYGITPNQYDQLLILQKNSCAICAEVCSANQRLSIDHDHLSGNVRGLLCARCNFGIGQFDDNPVKLIAATEYLQSFIKSEFPLDYPRIGA